MARNLFLVSIILLSTFLYSCSPVKTSNNQPSYEEILSKWTKQSRAYHKVGSETIIVDATYKSAEFRRAFTSEYSRLYGFRTGDNKKPVYSEIVSNGQEISKYHEFFFSLYTPTPQWNDLHKKDSIWDVYLEVDGLRVKPSSIKKSNKEDARTANFYPYIGPWSQAYVVRFPKGGEDVGSIKLLFFSVKAKLELEWLLNKPVDKNQPGTE